MTPAIQSGLAGNHGMVSLYGPDGRKDMPQRIMKSCLSRDYTAGLRLGGGGVRGGSDN